MKPTHPAESRRNADVQPLEPRTFLAANGGFVDVVDHLYLPLMPGSTFVFRGSDASGNPVRSRINITGETKQITGVTTTVVRERVYAANGQVVRDTREYFAQDEEGNVWRFGQARRAVQGGAFGDAGSSWEAGVAGAEAGIVLKAQPRPGDAYQLAGAPGESPAQMQILALDQRARVPFATFADCITTQQTAASSDADREQAYAPGIGLVRSESNGQLLHLAYVHLESQAFADSVDNPYFPLKAGTTLIYRGVDNGVSLRTRVTITGETKQIMGVDTTVVRVRETEEGELFEDTVDYYAQDKAGNVWAFGELSRQYEDGVIVGTEGSWEAGTDGALPGLFMRAAPVGGDVYHLENAPGVAEDQAEILGTQPSLHVPYQKFNDVLRVQDSSPLEPADVELKYYVPGIGLVMEESADGEDVENLKLAYVLIE
jgi:hypothetical protein